MRIFTLPQDLSQDSGSTGCCTCFSFTGEFPEILLPGLMNSTFPTHGFDNEVNDKLVRMEERKERMEKSLLNIAYVNMILILPALLIVLLFLPIKAGIGFNSREERIFFVPTACLFIINIAAIAVYFVAVFRKRKGLLIVYVGLNMMFMMFELVTSLSIYSSISEDGLTRNLSKWSTGLLITTLILIAGNCCVSTQVNNKIQQLTGTEKTIERTLTSLNSSQAYSVKVRSDAAHAVVVSNIKAD